MNIKLLSGLAAGALAAGALTVILSGDEAKADRVDTWQSATAKVMNAELSLLSDGGCKITARGEASKAGGGQFSSVVSKELSGTNRTACLDVLTKAQALWKIEEGL